jgi:hypothetical protein
VEQTLTRLESLVSDFIIRHQNPATPFTAAGVDDVRSILHQEIRLIQQTLVKNVFQLHRSKEIERFIQYHQLSLTEMLDRIFSTENQVPSPSTALSQFCQIYYLGIQELLSFIEERFSKYFNKQAKVPDVYFVLTKKEIEEKWQKISVNRDPSESQPLEIIHSGLTKFFENKSGKTVSYNELIYRKMLVTELAENAVKTDSFSAFEQTLIYANYNDKSFVHFMIERFEKKVGNVDDTRDQINTILHINKDLHQLLLKPDIALNPGHPSLIHQLSQWLSEELYYLERRLAMYAVPYSKNSSTENKTLIECRVPVDQIGIFFRAATDAKIIFTPSQKKIFEQIAPYLSTPRRPFLSADSMRSKSYNPEKKDLEGVKNLLMLMYKQVASY